MVGPATARVSLVLGVLTAGLAAASAMAVWQVRPWPSPLAAFGCVGAVVLLSYGWAWFLGWQGWGAQGAAGMVASVMGATALFIGHAMYQALTGVDLAGERAVALVGGGAVGVMAVGYAIGWLLAGARAERSAAVASTLGRSARVAALLAACATVSGVVVAGSAVVRDLGQASYRLIDELPPMAASQGHFSEERPLIAGGVGDARAFTLGRTCIGHRCLAHVVPTAGSPRSFGPQFDQSDSLRLLHSPGRHLLLLEAGGQALAVSEDAPGAWDWRTPSALDTGRLLGALPALAAMAAFGLLAALFTLAFRSVLARKLESVRLAIAGHVEAGWLRLEHHALPTRVTTAHEGPVLADFGAADFGTTAGPYRGDAQDAGPKLLLGERGDLSLALERRIDTLDAAALGFASCFSAPLCAAFAAWFWL
jgi:hypothetical protein